MSGQQQQPQQQSRPHPHRIRRGNTSGLIGLWNQKSAEASTSAKSPAAAAAAAIASAVRSGGGGGTLVVTEFSAGVDADTLAVRESAHRRISVRDPPKLQTLDEFSSGLLAGTVQLS